MKHSERIAILDFGGQTTQLIARRLRELGVYCEILPFNATRESILTADTRGVIFSGGPASVHESGSPHPDPTIYEGDLPVLGICYGMQLIGQHYGSPVTPGPQGEFGPSKITLKENGNFWKGLDKSLNVWMSHGDHIECVQEPLQQIGDSERGIVTAVMHKTKPVYGVQFHPEVTHTQRGSDILKNFAFEICGCHGGWSMASFIDDTVAEVRRVVGDGRVLCALSGGLDSTVTAFLLARAIGDRLICVHVDGGLSRKQETEQIVDLPGTVRLLNHRKTGSVQRCQMCQVNPKIFFQVWSEVRKPCTSETLVGPDLVRECLGGTSDQERARRRFQLIRPDGIAGQRQRLVGKGAQRRIESARPP